MGAKVRFCGMEISRAERGYHLGRYGDGGYGSVIPISKDTREMPEEENITVAEVQAAQKVRSYDSLRRRGRTSCS